MIAGKFDNPSPPYYNSPMNTPFPGMDPYLEHPTLWADVHDSLLAAIRDDLVPLVAPTYYVALQRHAYLLLTGGERTYLGKPDVAVGVPKLPVGAWSPMPVASGAGVLEVEVPMEEEVDENYLEVREVKTGKLITVIELLLVQLNTILHNLYQRARFDLRLDYTVPPTPPLAPDDAQWAQTLLAA